MIKYVVVIGVFFISNAAIAENQGIAETNYGVSASVLDSDSGDRISISGRVRLPIADYTGASIGGRYSNLSGDNNFLDSSTSAMSLGVFFRKYDLGIISANYYYSQTEVDSSIEELKHSINSVSLSGVYYYEEFDIGVSRSRANLDSGKTSNASAASVFYYVGENLIVGASIMKMDADNTNLTISYQPESFGNSTALSVSYQDSETNDTLSISLSYYFDTRVSAKDRARRY